MPRLSRSFPKYHKHRGSGQAVVTINTRDFYLGPHSTKASKIEYDRLLGEWLANGRNLLHAVSQNILLVELCLRYWEFANPRRKYDFCPGYPTIPEPSTLLLGTLAMAGLIGERRRRK